MTRAELQVYKQGTKIIKDERQQKKPRDKINILFRLNALILARYILYEKKEKEY